jgi:hypothetical protein
MKITVTVPRSGPSVEPELLVRFVIVKCNEIIEQDRTTLPPIWAALALSAISHDQAFHSRLKEVVASSSASAEEILGLCRDVFLPALGRLQNGPSPDDPDRDEAYPAPDEKTSRRVLGYALREGKKMIVSGDYEFAGVVELLTWASLVRYAVRLYQFEAVRQSCASDPESLIRQGVEILRATAFSPKKKK